MARIERARPRTRAATTNATVILVERRGEGFTTWADTGTSDGLVAVNKTN
jgi:hypothetical protein